MTVFIGKLVTYEDFVTAWTTSSSVEVAMGNLTVPYTADNRLLVQGTVNKLRDKGVTLAVHSDELASLQQITPAVVITLNQLIDSL